MVGLLLAALVVGAIIAFGRIHDLQKDLQDLRSELAALRKELSQRERPTPMPSAPVEPPAPAPPQPKPTYAPAPPIQAATHTATPPPTPPVVSPPPPTVKARSPMPAAPKTPKPSRTFDWESLVGVQLFSWIAGISLVLAAVFFLKYSVEHGWLSPTVRAAIGLMTGTALLVVCELRIARGYSITANALHGAGIAILYSTLFATYALWHLLPGAVVFALMLGVTALAVMLSIRRDSVFIALLGLMGGFATPALLSTGENRPFGLFSYLLLLNIGLAWVAFRKGWPALTVGSLIFTVAYQWGWTARFLTASQLPVAATIFAVFAVAGTSALWIRGSFAAKSERPEFERTAIGSAIAPLAFAMFGSAVPAYGERFNVLFAFLLMMTAGLAAIAMTRGPKWLHALGGGTTLITFAVWSTVSYTNDAWPSVLAWVAAFVVLYLAAGLRLKTRAAITAGLLFFMFPLLLVTERAAPGPFTLFATMFVLLVLAGAYAVYARSDRPYFVAALFAILAEGVWSAKSLNPANLYAGLTIYASFALLFLGLPIVARRLGRALDANGTSAIVILALGVLFFLTGPSIAASSLWGLAVLLGVLLIGTFIEASAACRPWLAAMAMLLGWAVLASWWTAAPVGGALIPALTVVTAFALASLSGVVWTSRHDPAAGFDVSGYLVLAGYFFLMFVATRRELSIPPWPMFAVFAILAVAIGTAALYLRRGNLLVAGVVASQIVLVMWSAGLTSEVWANVALAATLSVGAFGVVMFVAQTLLSARAQTGVSVPQHESFFAAAVVGLFVAHVVAIVAGRAPSQPMFGSLLATHAVIALTLLVVAWMTEHHELAIIEVPLAAIATGLALLSTPSREFTFAAVLYAMFIAYPLTLGTRAKRRFEPYLAAVLASIPFFFFARDAMLRANLGWCIGVLPLGQAALMFALVAALLRIEPPGRRELTRLATVSGAALAFVTVAIPLQLDKQWITIGWAFEAAALVWLFTRIPHRGLLVWSGALLAAVFARLVFNPAVFSYHAASHFAIFNWYLYTYLVSAMAFFAVAFFWPRDVKGGIAAATTGGTILLFVLLNIEIADFYSRGPNLTFNFFSSSLGQDLTYTIGWAVFAIAMLVAGIVMRTRAARIAALVLLVVTILKCFLHDLARLGGLYRVGSLLGLAVSLVLVGVLLQKFVMAKTAAPPVEETA